VTIAPVSLDSRGLRALREAQPRALYAARERTVSVPAGSAPSERLEAADEVLDVLLDTAPVAA